MYTFAAQTHAAEDRASREKVELKNRADQQTYQTEKQLKELEGKIDPDSKAKVEAALERLKEAVKKDQIGEISSASEALTTVWHDISAKLYQQQTASQQTAGQSRPKDQSKPDDAVDADYEVVD